MHRFTTRLDPRDGLARLSVQLNQLMAGFPLLKHYPRSGCHHCANMSKAHVPGLDPDPDPLILTLALALALAPD